MSFLMMHDLRTVVQPSHTASPKLTRQQLTNLGLELEQSIRKCNMNGGRISYRRRNEPGFKRKLTAF
jgi:hypothetical protein